jgi:hypothetical protein
MITGTTRGRELAETVKTSSGAVASCTVYGIFVSREQTAAALEDIALAAAARAGLGTQRPVPGRAAYRKEPLG